MEKNSNNLLKENMKKSKEINDVISKYKELGNEMHNLSSKSYELEKKNSIMEVSYFLFFFKGLIIYIMHY